MIIHVSIGVLMARESVVVEIQFVVVLILYGQQLP